MEENMRLYIAAPIVGTTEEKKEKTKKVAEIMSKQPWANVYEPEKHGVPNAWGMSMDEWARAIFALDVVAINNADWVVVCDFGRQGTAGTAWECGYAFGQGKKVLIVEMYDNETDYSVMMRGCSANYCKYTALLDRDTEDTVRELFVERGKKGATTVLN